MNVNEHLVPSSAQHYSGQNRIPNIQEFMERLDNEKKDRDAAIDNDLKRNKAAGETHDHVNEEIKKKNTRSVRDPVTGKDVEIRDADLTFEEAVDHPQVRPGQLSPSFVLCMPRLLTAPSFPCPTRTWASRPR